MQIIIINFKGESADVYRVWIQNVNEDWTWNTQQERTDYAGLVI